jgi:hypothetical protein
MTKDGKSLEQLVALIETALGSDGVSVETRKRLPDRITGKPREHDVLVTITRGHHLVQIALECKDRSRPVTVDMVEAFHQKCQDTAIQQGAIVSASGFAKTARNKAAHYGIRCLEVLETESFAWMLAPSFTFLTRRIDSQSWRFFPTQDGVVEKHNMEVLLEDGRVVPKAAFDNTARAALNKWVDEHPELVEKRTVELRIGTPGLILRNKETGSTTLIRYADLTLTYSLVQDEVPLQFSQYMDGDKPITDVAIADGPTGKIAFVYNESEGGSVMFQPRLPPAAKREE